jgi:hypothetical protein
MPTIFTSMGSDLLSLIENRLRNNESPESVRRSLQNQGVAPNEIDYAFYKHDFRKKLREYAAQHLASGYQRKDIAEHLRKSGYEEDDIRAAIIAERLRIPSTIIIGLVLLGLMTIGIAFIIFQPKGEPLLDYEVIPSTKTVTAGHVLPFTAKVMNFGSEKRYDVELRHAIIDLTNQTEIDTSTETLAVETQSIKACSLMIPEQTPPGRYALVSRAVYDGRKAEASFIFTVIQEISDLVKENLSEQEDVIRNASSDNKTSPQPPLVNTTSLEQKPLPDKLDELNRLLKTTDQEAAALICHNEEVLMYRDYCYDKIATKYDAVAYCAEIADDDKRDFCYVTVAINSQDKSICEKIGRTYVRASCLSM